MSSPVYIPCDVRTARIATLTRKSRECCILIFAREFMAQIYEEYPMKKIEEETVGAVCDGECVDL